LEVENSEVLLHSLAIAADCSCEDDSKHICVSSFIAEVWLAEYQGNQVAIRLITGVGKNDRNSEFASRRLWTKAVVTT